MAEADQIKFLLDHEVLLSSCCKTDPKELFDKMFRKCIIPDGSFFNSLDHNRVDSGLQVRYLIRLVSMRVCEDKSVWEIFLALLTSLGESQMCECLSKYRDNEDIDVWYDCLSEFPSMSDNKVGSDNVELNQMPSKVNITFLDTPLCADDTSWILDILVQASHKWELIARALKLPTYKIDNCRRIDNKLSLDNVISNWISSNPSEVTMNTLLTALKSKLVEENWVAEELKDTFLQNKSSLIIPKKNTSVSFLSLSDQSSIVEVADGKSTLLQVQATTTESVVCYQWKKGGQPLANNDTYHGVNEDILAISHASQGAEGEYTCDVSCSQSTKCSNTVSLTVLYAPAKKRLLDLYSIHTEVPQDLWPPIGTKSFINLTVVQSNPNVVISENADEDSKTIVEINYSKVFREYDSGTLIVIEGRPGSGKTTLARKIIKDWSKGTLLMKAKLVFIIVLRTVNHSTTQETLSGILKSFYLNPEELKIVCEDIEAANGEGVCFIIDGLDEYHPQNRDISLVYQLLDKTFLPLSMVIVMSRQVAIETIGKEFIKQKIEVLGFNKEQIIKYIKIFPFADSSSNSQIATTYPDKLMKYLYSHQDIFNLCELPFHTAMICFLFKYQKGNIPNTQTKMYQEFTRSIILRHLRRTNSKAQLHSLKDLRGSTRDHFNELCHLAYKMTVNKKQVATPEIMDKELCEHVGSNSDEWCLGLVTINHIAELSGVTDTYSFLHLTIQEFLTAYYITTLEREKQEELFPDLPSMSLQVTIFYFGLFQFPSTTGFKIHQLQTRFDSFLNLIFHIAFESQQQAVCDEVGEYYGDIYNLFYTTPSHLDPINYVLLNTSRPIIGISAVIYTDCSFSFTNVLQSLDKNKFHSLLTLKITKDLNNVETLTLSDILKYCFNLKKASFLFHEINHDSAESITDTFQGLTCLESLDISCRSTSGGIITLLSGLHSLADMDLPLSFYGMDSSGVLEVGIGLHFTNSQKITLSRCSINEDAAVALAIGLHSNVNVQELNISNNSISYSGAIGLLSKIHYLTKLTTVDLTYNGIDGDGATALACSLQHLVQLRQLNLSHNKIGPKGASSLAITLHCLTELQTLHLSHNEIGPSGVVSLAAILHRLPNLSWLYLSHNNIDLASAILLISASKYNLCMLCITLTSDPNISCAGYRYGIYVEGLVSPEDDTAITVLMEASKHPILRRELHLGFKFITIWPLFLVISSSKIQYSHCVREIFLEPILHN